MATTTPFAYNPSLSPISGTTQVGQLAVGATEQDYSISPGGVTWWMGPDEDLGYVIAVPVSGNTQPTQIPGVFASVGFFRSEDLTDNSFIDIAEYVANEYGTPQTFSSVTDASIWLTNNGYWNSYISPVLYLDAGNLASYPGTGTVWTDLIGGKVFNLINGPGYDPGDGGKFYFFAPGGQYAQCNTSLQSLPEFTTSVWHNWDGTNTGEFPCILTEVYVGGTINYVLGNPQGSVAQGGYFNGGFQLSPQFGLTANTWYNIVTTCDSSQVVRVYVNNVLLSTTSTTGGQPSSSNAGIRLMRRWDFGSYWGGYLATVQIYDQALSSGQVSSIWDSTKTRFGYGVPTPTPTSTVTPTPTITPTNTLTPTPTATNTPTPSPTNTPTPTPTTSPIPVTGFGYNLVVLPYEPPTSGNTIFPRFTVTGVTSGVTTPNTFNVNGVYWNAIDNLSVNRTSYYSGMTGTSVTAYFTQNGDTAIYSGSSTAFTFEGPPGQQAFNYNPGARPGQLTLIQSASTNFVTGQTVYISYIVN